MVAWPGTLPQTPLYVGYEENTPDLLVRTGMDTGPDKIRRRATAGVREITWPTILTIAQVATLETFYITTLASGALTFTLNHPRTAVGSTWRFVKAPTYTQVPPGNYRAVLKLEILP